MQHSSAFLNLVDSAKQKVRECTVQDVKDRQDRQEDFHFIDVREESEYASGRAAGARRLGRGILERDIETLIMDRSAPIVLYCGGGFRSALAAESLTKMGYSNVVSMDGGMRAWREAGFPVDP